MKNKFFQGVNGNWSSTRLIGFIVTMAALALAEQVLLYRGDESIIVTAAASGTLFLTVAGPAMAFLFVQKKTEIAEAEIKAA